MAYSKTTWINGTTPINATNLNHIEDGIASVESEIPEVKTTQTSSSTATYSCNYVNDVTGTIIYNNPSGATNNFQLTDSVANYKRIDIVYATNDGNIGTKTCYNYNTNFNTALFEWWTSSGTGDALYLKSGQLIFSGSSVNYANRYETSLTAGTLNRTATTNISIYKVIGYK